MSLKELDRDELAEVAEFFLVDVESAKEKPTKKELLAALASGDEPVTEEDYQTFLTAKKNNQVKSKEVLAQEAEAERLAQEESAEASEPKEEDKVEEPEPVQVKQSVNSETPAIVKFEGRNPRLDMFGHTFTKAHPFASVDNDTAAYLIRNVPGFRLALPVEVTEYYDR